MDKQIQELPSVAPEVQLPAPPLPAVPDVTGLLADVDAALKAHDESREKRFDPERQAAFRHQAALAGKPLKKKERKPCPRCGRFHG